MKNTNKGKKILTGIIAGIMMMTTASAIAASADNTDTYDTSSVSVSRRYSESEQINKIFKKITVEKKRKEHEKLEGIEKTVTIHNYGFYHAKNVKFYGRRITGVDDNGEYILGNWEQINKKESFDGGMGVYALGIKHKFEGHYAEYAFSFDITWGTDFPYSGVFWSDLNDTNGSDISISFGGTCRRAEINIYVGDKTVVSETNCSAHSEWKPQ